jgi:hypothetical protein
MAVAQPLRGIHVLCDVAPGGIDRRSHGEVSEAEIARRAYGT